MNEEMIELYWSISEQLNEQVQYGNAFIDTLAKEIKLDSPKVKGFFCKKSLVYEKNCKGDNGFGLFADGVCKIKIFD